jgi:hypothetical protein
MRFVAVFGVSWLLALLPNANASAQTVAEPRVGILTAEVLPLSLDQGRELTVWLAAMGKWQQLDARWQNRPVYDGWGHIVERKASPAAPIWLAARCAALNDAHLMDLETRTADACRLLDDPRRRPAGQSVIVSSETPPKHTAFLSRVHIDMLATQSNMGSRLYGVIGAHISLVDVGRVQFYGPPGVMMMTVPTENGGHRVTFGYSWGASVRLADLRLRSAVNNATLYLNVSKVWMGSSERAASDQRGYDMVGFSISPRKQQ